MYNRFSGKSNDYPFLQTFARACQLIEKDPNFQPEMDEKTLLNIIKNDEIYQKNPLKKATIIQRSNINTEKGALYQLKIAQRGFMLGLLSEPAWHINKSIVMLVRFNGCITFHHFYDAKRDNFSFPFDNFNIHQFIGNEMITEKKEINANIGINRKRT